jgi:predicted TIM-barrel fold metal-dependent hydrolase
MWNGTKVLDVHAHVSPPMQGTGMVNMLLRGANTVLPDPLSPGVDAAFGLDDEAWQTSVSRHLAVMDARKIDVQVLGPRPFLLSADMQPRVFNAWTRFVNDSIARQCRMHPDRFVGACQLPQDINAPDASHVLAELDRCVAEHGFVGVYVSPDPLGNHSGPGMADQWWDPLYKTCEERELPIIIHGTANSDPRLAHVPQNYQLNFVAEQYWANQSLAHSDVFDRFPGLRVIVCHCGGALDRWIPTDPHLSQRDLSQNLYYDTCAHDVHYLEAAIKQRTVARMMFGTEAPGSGSAIRPDTGKSADDLIPVIEAFEFLTEQDKLDLFHENAARLFPAMAKL